MKPTSRDYLTILAGFLTVFLCGYGVGRLTAGKPDTPVAGTTPAWEEQSLAILVQSLELDTAERQVAEAEIQSAATTIRSERSRTILAYHEHLSALYQRLIDRLGEPHAVRLREEKRALDARIESLRPRT